MGKPAATDRPCLPSLSHSFTLDSSSALSARTMHSGWWRCSSKRLGRFGLTLHPDKTRLLPFRRPPTAQQSGKGSATFDFLGFTLYWARSRKGHWGMACKTRRASLRRADSVRHRLVPSPSAPSGPGAARRAQRRLRGHFNYFGVSGNFRSLLLLVEAAKRAWYKWLCRRSQRTRLTWERFADLLDWCLSRVPGSRSGSGAGSHEPPPRKSRMVEISSSGSGEGPGWATPRATRQRHFCPAPRGRALRRTCSAPLACGHTSHGLCTHAPSAGRPPSSNSPKGRPLSSIPVDLQM